MAANGTGVVDISSDLVRKKWMREGLIQNASKSFWAPYTGNSAKSIVFQAKNENASDGHTVVFDFDGNLVGKPVKGKTTATGKGEQKRKFSDKTTVDRYRFIVDNGDEFDGVNVGDLSITQHTDSRSKLADLWVRAKDQALFDTAQMSITHRITSATFTFDNFLDVENTIKTGIGYATGAKRVPLQPFMMSDGKPVWLMVIDSNIKNKLMKSTGAQQVFRDADVRGNDNRVITGVIGKVGNFLLVEADTFFGSSTGANGSTIVSKGYANLDSSEIQFSGLRQYKTNGTAFTPALWTGETGFDASVNALTSRALIMGAGALQNAYGRMPNYKFKESEDFGINTESMMEIWTSFRATKMTAENDDYAVKIGGISNGIVGLDITI